MSDFTNDGRKMKLCVVYTDGTEMCAATQKELVNKINNKHGSRVFGLQQLRTALYNQDKVHSAAYNRYLQALHIQQIAKL
jgi:hypothetical protein